jgi:hypothetical protein
VAALLLAPAAAVSAAPRTLAVPTLLGQYILAFDDARILEAELRELIVLSPHLSGWTSMAVAPRLERCVIDDAAYLDCGSRTPAAPNFLWNARANVARGVAMRAGLDRLRVPDELAPVVAWLRQSLAFSLWLEETRLDFHTTGRAEALARRYEDIEPARVCGEVLARIAAAGRAEQHELAALQWHNCVNDAYRQKLGDYPHSAWNRFLAAHGIVERLIERGAETGPVDSHGAATAPKPRDARKRPGGAVALD